MSPATALSTQNGPGAPTAKQSTGTADRTPSKVIRTLQAIGPATAVLMGLTAAVYAACATVTALTGGPLP